MSRCRVALICFAVCAVAGPVSADEGPPAPGSTKLSWIEASIRALHENGVAERVAREHGVALADGTRALPLKHVVDCETEADCVRVARWARRSGFAPSAVLTEFGHGGFAHYRIYLRHRLPLIDRRIQSEAVRIHRALRLLPGTRYETWMLDVDPEGGRGAR